MKKQMLAFAVSLLLTLPAVALPKTPAQPTDTAAQPTKVAIATDSVTKIALNEDGITIEAPVSANPDQSQIFIDDGEAMVRLNGETVSLSSLVPAPEINGPFEKMPSEAIVSIVALALMIPGAVIVIAVVVLLNFLKRRNRERNEVVMRAIDAGYQLPDAFYTKQPTMVNSGQPSDRTSSLRANPSVFSTGITLLVIGACVMIFFFITGHPAVAFLIGGTPFFIGVAKLIGFYTIPGYGINRNRMVNNNYAPRQNYGYPQEPRQPQQPQQPYGPQQPVQPQTPQQPYNGGSNQCPPPFNPS